MKFRPRIHLLTAIILQIELGVLIWANMRPVELQGKHELVVGGTQPGSTWIYEPGPILYGWPCTARSDDQILYIETNKMEPMKNLPSYNSLGIAIDCAVACVLLIITWLVSERLLFRPKPLITAHQSPTT